jgi:hypothetical protein
MMSATRECQFKSGDYAWLQDKRGRVAVRVISRFVYAVADDFYKYLVEDSSARCTYALDRELFVVSPLEQLAFTALWAGGEQSE